MTEGYKIVVFANSIFKKRNESRMDSRKLDFDIQLYSLQAKKEIFLNKFLIRETCFIPNCDPAEINLIQISYTSSPRGAHLVVPTAMDEDICGYDSLRNSWGELHNNIYLPIKPLNDTNNIHVFALRGGYVVPTGYTKIATIYGGNSGIWHVIINKNIWTSQFDNYQKIAFGRSISKMLAEISEDNFDEIADEFDKIDLNTRLNYLYRYATVEEDENIKKSYGNVRSLKVGYKKILFSDCKVLALLEIKAENTVNTNTASTTF